MGLHENQMRAAGRGGQFVGHPGAAVFLLRGGDQQHVALGQDRPQPGEVVARRGEGRGERGEGGDETMRPIAFPSLSRLSLSLLFRRVRIGAIDQHQVAQRRQVAFDPLDRGRIDAEQFGRQAGPANERGPGGGGTGAAGLHDFGPEQGVDQRALAGAGAAERGDDQRRFEPHPQRVGPLGQPTHQRPALLGRLPCRRIVGPTVEPIDQRVDFREHFEMCQFRAGHDSKIPSPDDQEPVGRVDTCIARRAMFIEW